jgi:site-specific DNA recombinase
VTAVAYCRISADKTGAGLGVERQAADCRELAGRLGLPAPEVITDNDLSAYSGKRRPGYDRLLAGLREGRWSTLLVWHVDRLTRNLRDLEDVVDAVNGRCAVHTVRGGEIDLETSEGRLQARMLGSVARYESEHRSDRVKRKMLENAENGRTHGGPRRYGYTADGAVITAEAGILEELTRRVVGGESIRSLAAELQARAVPSARGGPWRADMVRKLVLRPRNAGLREHNGQLYAAVWPAVVDRDTWEAAVALLTDPARRTSPGNAPARLLSGIADCGVPGCGQMVRSGGARHGVAVYRCASGEHVKRKVSVVDALVEEYLLGSRDVMGMLLREAEANLARVRNVVDNAAKIDAVRLRIEQVEDALVGDPTEDLQEVSAAGLRRNLTRLQKQLADLQRAEALSRVPDAEEDITPESWPSLPLDRRRAVVKRKVRVVIHPMRDTEFPDGVEIIPKRPALLGDRL